MSQDLPFEPCDAHCPALTGQPYNRVKYCPMLEPWRHERWKNWYRTLTREQKLVRWQNSHPDETDCCANFQCCSEVFEEAGLGNLKAMLTEGHPIIHVYPQPEPGQ